MKRWMMAMMVIIVIAIAAAAERGALGSSSGVDDHPIYAAARRTADGAVEFTVAWFWGGSWHHAPPRTLPRNAERDKWYWSAPAPTRSLYGEWQQERPNVWRVYTWKRRGSGWPICYEPRPTNRVKAQIREWRLVRTDGIGWTELEDRRQHWDEARLIVRGREYPMLSGMADYEFSVSAGINGTAWLEVPALGIGQEVEIINSPERIGLVSTPPGAECATDA